MNAPKQSNVRLRPIIRVFVSSTFSDMKHERNALQADVFPNLEQLCLRHGFQFQAIDLRWGVSSEAGLDHRTMRICFDELRRAQEISPRPNFLILLGNRYGWRPLPEEIVLDEFEALDRAAAQVASTGDKPAVEVLREWYRKDENAIPPVYLLQSRRQRLPDAKDYTQEKPWNEVQADLWEIINRAMPPEQLQGRFYEAALAGGALQPIVRFQASATEQEIWHGALRVPDAHEHVLAFFRQIENVGDFSEPAQIKEFVDLELSESIDEALSAQQERLKQELRKRLSKANVFETRSARLVPARGNQGGPATDVTTDHLAQLCSDVETRLLQIIQGQIEEYWNKTDQASTERAERELKIEQDEHERFGRERGGEDSFVGRQTELQAIFDYVRNDSPWPLVIHGASGCGKTALLARAAGELQKSEGCDQTQKVIVRFIGVTPRSSDVRSLLGSLCQELRLRRPREGELPADTKALGEELHEQFRSTKPEQPLILFLDALDQLSDADGGRLLNWIPAGPLPGHVKLVVSCLSDRAAGDPAGRPYAELSQRQLPAENFINLDVLSEDEARTLLFNRWLNQAGRTVSLDQRGRIEQRLASAACRQPIYLKLLFEEVRLWRSNDALPDLGEGVSAVLGQLFERLSQPANHGQLLVERVLGYLAASRHGLAENEILEVLFADPDYKAALDQATEQTHHELPAGATRIPIAIWSRLRFDLAPYLTERAAPGANVLTFYHRQVAEWIQEYLANEAEQTWRPHRLLADYFRDLADPDKNQTWKGESPRPLLELPFHLARADVNELSEILLAFNWLQAKINKRLVQELIQDFDEALRALPREHPQRAVLGLLHGAVRLSAHTLDKRPCELAGQILGRLLGEEATELRWLCKQTASLAPRPCLLPHSPSLDAPGVVLLCCFEGHQGSVHSVAINPDGKTALSGSGDTTLALWDLASGKLLRSFEGHRGRVHAVAISPDGKTALSGSEDKTLKLWDLASGRLLNSFEGHNARAIKVIAISHDGQTALSGSEDETLALWDLASGKLLRSFKHRQGSLVTSVAISPDDKIALSGCGNGYFGLWDLASGELLRSFRGHNTSFIGALDISPDGQTALSGSGDETLGLWDLATGELLRSFEGHRGHVNAVAISPDGKIALSGSEDRTLKLWDLEAGKLLRSFEGHQGEVKTVAISPDGKTALSGSEDRTLRLWALAPSQLPRSLEVYRSGVRAVAISPDGKTALSGSFDELLRPWKRGLGDETLKLWDLASGKLLRSFDGYQDQVYAVAINPDGKTALSGSPGGTSPKVWDLVSGKLLRSLEQHHDWTSVVTLSISLDGKIALSGSEDETLKLWDLSSGKLLRVFQGHQEWAQVHAVAIGPDCNIALSGSKDGTLRLWDLASGKLLRSFERHQAGVWAVAISPDGKTALSGSEDRTLKLWDLATGKLLHSFEGHQDCVGAVCISPDGKTALSGSKDRTIKLWDLASGRVLGSFTADAALYCVTLAADGRIAVAGDSLGRLHVIEIAQATHSDLLVVRGPDHDMRHHTI